MPVRSAPQYEKPNPDSAFFVDRNTPPEMFLWGPVEVWSMDAEEPTLCGRFSSLRSAWFMNKEIERSFNDCEVHVFHHDERFEVLML